MRYLALIYLVVFAAIGVFALTEVGKNAPAFTETLRENRPDGSWDVPDRTAHYDQARYLYHLGYELLHANPFQELEANDALQQIDPQALTNRIDRANGLLRESLSLNPSNAHVWANLAVAQTINEDDKAALVSIRQAWGLAPYNQQLAELRLLSVALILDRPSEFELTEALASINRHHIIKDADVLRRFAPEDLKLLELSSEPLKQLIIRE